MTSKLTAEQAANADVLAAVRYRVNGGRPTKHSILVSQAEQLRRDGFMDRADEKHRATFGPAATLSVAQAEAIVRAENAGK